MKVCGKCGINKTEDNFYLMKNGKYYSYCKDCKRETHKEWSKNNRDIVNIKRRLDNKERKAFAIDYLGGVCEVCGEMPHIAAMDFHHKDPDQKEITVGWILHSKKETLIKELDKCILVCSNCHRVLHVIQEST